MEDEEKLDQEPEVREAEKHAEHPKPRRSFSKVRRELTEEELCSPAVQRLLLDELDKLELSVFNLTEFRDLFHKADKENAVLQGKLQESLSSEILFGVCITLGAAIIGLTPGLWSSTPYGYIFLGIGVILIIGGVIARVVRKWI